MVKLICCNCNIKGVLCYNPYIAFFKVECYSAVVFFTVLLVSWFWSCMSEYYFFSCSNWLLF